MQFLLVTCQVQGPRGEVGFHGFLLSTGTFSGSGGGPGGGGRGRGSVCVRGKEERSSTNFKSHPKILKLQPGVAAWAKASFFFVFFLCGRSAMRKSKRLKRLGLYLKIAAVHNFIFLPYVFFFFFFCASFFFLY